MSMAACIGARRLILNWSNNPQNTSAAAVAKDAKAVRTVQPGQRLRLGMAPITGFRALIDDVVEFRWVGRIGDLPFFVKDANLRHAGLIGNGADRPIESFTVVAQHVFSGAALNDIADT